VRILLLTPTPEIACVLNPGGPEDESLRQHAQQVRDLASEYGIGLMDSLAAFEMHAVNHDGLENLLSWVNHPNRDGHELVVQELLRWFLITPLSETERTP
jgi:acyl-CoA thioesterase I